MSDPTERTAVNIGFTGTRQGITEYQAKLLDRLLSGDGISLAHHGDCVGADAAFHQLCLDHHIPVVIHPPADDKLRAFCTGAVRTELPEPYPIRDRAIVNQCELLIATPKEAEEPPPARGQGTWSTIRYARRIGRRVLIIPPAEPRP